MRCISRETASQPVSCLFSITLGVRFLNKCRMAPFPCKFKRLHLQNCSNGFSLQKAFRMYSMLSAVVKSRMPHGYSCEPCDGHEFQHWFEIGLTLSPYYTVDTCGYMLRGSGIAFCAVLCGLAEISRMIHRCQRLHPLRPSVTIVLIQVV